MTMPTDELKKLAEWVKSFRNADTEFRRANWSGEQPRLNKAGTRYACAEYKMFCALEAALRTRAAGEGE
jgi:hypothetical protein